MYQSKETEIIAKTLKETAKISEEILAEDSFEVEHKQDASEVTVVDLVNQIVINKALQKHFPDEDMIGEESDLSNYSEELLGEVSELLQKHFKKEVDKKEIKSLLNNPRQDSQAFFWTADPIDGTEGFTQKKQFAEMMAHISTDGIISAAGIMYHDNHVFDDKPYELLIAKRGEGAYIEGGDTVLQVVPKEKELEIITRGKFENPQFSAAIKEEFDVKCMESIKATSQIALIALGKLDVFIQQADQKEPLKIWDLAAPMLIAQEAGAIITDLEGQTYHLSKTAVQTESPSGIIISNNPEVHQRIIELWQQYK